MKNTPAARGPDPHREADPSRVIHRRVSRDEEWPRFACGAPAGRSGAGWGTVDCPGCLAAQPPAPAPSNPVVEERKPFTMPAAPARPRRVLPT